MKRTTKWMTLILSLAIVMNSMILSGSSKTALPVALEETASSTVAVGAVNEPMEGEEIVAWREDGVKHYYLGNGQYQAVISATGNLENGDISTPAAATPNTAAMQDTYISSSNPATKYGFEQQLWVSNTQTAFFRCNLPDLPAGANITDARLYFMYKYNIDTGWLSVGAYPVNFSWTEAQLNWVQANSYDNLGIGTNCLGTATLNGTKTAKKAYTFITNEVRLWYMSNLKSNFGIALKRRSGTNNSVILLPREAGSDVWPYFVINYTLETLPIEDGTYYIRSGKHLAYFVKRSVNSSNNCEIVKYDDEPSQKWIFEYLHNGYYIIRNFYNEKVLAVASGYENTSNQLLVLDNTFAGDARQQWKLISCSNGLFKIKPRSSENYATDWAMCLADTDYTTPGGIDIVQNAYDGTDNSLDDEWKIQAVDADAVITYQTRLYYDTITSQQFSTNSILNMYQEATEPFKVLFGVEFQTPSVASLSTSLDVSAECANVNTPTAICTAACGSYDQCSSQHHKSSSYFLRQHSSLTCYTYRLVGHAICSYDRNKNTHTRADGAAYRYEKDVVVSLTAQKLNKTIQHEISHTLSTYDGACTENQPCVMKEDENCWCDNCMAAILTYIAEITASNANNN